MLDPKKWSLFEGYLALYYIQKFIITGLTLSCQIPGGIFMPHITMGAVFGQLYVSIVIRIITFFGGDGVNWIQCKFNFDF